jgi:glycogen(starch) synthase
LTMRVMLISNLYPPFYVGGYEISCSEVARGLASRGHDIRVLTTPSHIPASPDLHYIDRCLDLRWYDPYPANLGLTDYDVFASACSHVKNTLEIRSALLRFDPDLVYCWHMLGIGGLAILDLLTMLGVPWVLHLMDNVPDLLINPTPAKIRTIFTRAGYEILRDAKIISMSTHLLSEIVDKTGIIFRQHVEIIPGWVASNNLPLRTAYQSEGKTRFIMAGAIVPHKGMDLILEAAELLLQEGFNNFGIDFYGTGLTDHYLTVASAFGLTNYVHFLGGLNKSELLLKYANYDVFLFPTQEREPFGIAPIEAAACGCVPIITGNCGVSERLVHGVHCLKIERSIGGLADAMRAVLCKQVDLPAIGKAAAALVRSDLAFEDCMDRIERVLEAQKRSWDRSRLSDSKLPLLIFTKHHLARYLCFSNAYST